MVIGGGVSGEESLHVDMGIIADFLENRLQPFAVHTTGIIRNTYRFFLDVTHDRLDAAIGLQIHADVIDTGGAANAGHEEDLF